MAEGVDGWADQIGRDVAGDVEAWAEQFNSENWSNEFAAAAASAAGATFTDIYGAHLTARMTA